MLGGRFQSSDFVTSASFVPDTSESLKTHKSSWHASRRWQRSIDLKMFFVEYPARVISVAVLILVQFMSPLLKRAQFGNISEISIVLDLHALNPVSVLK